MKVNRPDKFNINISPQDTDRKATTLVKTEDVSLTNYMQVFTTVVFV